jgi:two-component system cell cycle sensor histidine kinase/response regulator CckA
MTNRFGLAFINDISERKAFEKHQRQAQKLESLGVLAGGIAHDFGSLLTAILGNTPMALEELPLNHPASQRGKSPQDAVGRIARLGW